MPAQRIPEYFTLLPSEICRLILGYLRAHDSIEAATTLFTHCNHLSELRSQYNSVHDLPLNLTQLTLSDLIEDYLKISNIVAANASQCSVSCRLGTVSNALAQLLQSSSASSPISSSRLRPSWMPIGKSTLPPRIISSESITRTIRPSFLAGHPNSFAHDPSMHGVTSLKTASAALSVRLASASLTRPVIRLYRHSAQQFGVANSDEHRPESVLPSTMQSASPSSIGDTSSLRSSQKTVTVKSVSPEPNTPDRDTGAHNEILDSAKPAGVAGKPAFPSIPSNCPSGNVSSISFDKSEKSRLLSGASALFDVLHHLPPPTEARICNSEPVQTNEWSASADSGPTVAKKRRRTNPRHLQVTSGKVESISHSTEPDDDVDLQRFLSALFANPEQVARQINAKIRHRSKTSPLSIFPDATNQDFHYFPSVQTLSSTPTLAAPTGVSSQTTTSDSPVALHPSRFSFSEVSAFGPDPTVSLDGFSSNDSITDWLESGEITDCIDHLLSQLDSGDCQPSNRPNYTIQSDVLDLQLPSRAPTPVDLPCVTTISSLNYVSGFSSSLTNKSHQASTTQPVRAPSPLCLSQLAKSTSRSPYRRRRVDRSRKSSSKKNSKNTVLHTPDTKSDNSAFMLQSPNNSLIRQDLFTTETTMRLYEEYVSHCTTQSTLLLPSTSVRTTDLSEESHLGIREPSTPIYQQPFSDSMTTTSVTFPSPVLPHVSSLVPERLQRIYLSAEQQNSSACFSYQLHASAYASQCQPTKTEPQLSTTDTRSNYLQPVLSPSLPGPPSSVPQTIIMYPPIGQVDSLSEKENHSPNTDAWSQPPAFLNLPTVHTLDRPVIIQLPPCSSEQGLSTVRMPPNPPWTGSSTVLLPVNVDLDSPNPYHTLPVCTFQSSESSSTDSSLVVQHTGSRRKILNLGSINVEQILSKSH